MYRGRENEVKYVLIDIKGVLKTQHHANQHSNQLKTKTRTDSDCSLTG